MPRKSDKPRTEAQRKYQREYMRGFRKSHPELYEKLYSSNEFKEKSRARKLRDRFNMTQEEYAAKLLEQGGVCAICLKPETIVQKGKIFRLAIDHDHATNKNRGLLCGNCNKALGQFHDDILVIQAAMEYLKKWNRQ